MRGGVGVARLRCASLLFLAALAFACDRPAIRGVDRILLITVDTLRADHVGAYGGSLPTPALDQLAREGVSITGFCTPTPSTGPATVSLLTGLHPWNHGVLLNAVPFDAPDLPTLAALLRDGGFATAAFVSSYVLHRRWGFARGFDLHHFEPTQLTPWDGRVRRFWSRGEAMTDAVLRWLEDHGDDPFFVWVHYFDPHDPYSPPPSPR